MTTSVELHLVLDLYGRCELSQRVDDMFKHWTVIFWAKNATAEQIQDAAQRVEGFLGFETIRDGVHKITFQGLPTVLAALQLLNSLAANLNLTCKQVTWTRAEIMSF